MNKTLMFVIGGVLVVVLIVGNAVIELSGIKDSKFIEQGMTALAFLSTFALLLLTNNSQEKKLDKIQRQTNGALTSRDETIRNQTEILVDNGIHPISGEPLPETRPIPVTRREYQESVNE